MAYEWGRLLWWLSQNSAAIQALSAFAGLLIAAVLAVITYWYANITSHLLAVTRGQLFYQLMPKLRILISDPSSVDIPTFTITNTGQDDVVIQDVTIAYRDRDTGKSAWLGLANYTHRILAPKECVEGHLAMVNERLTWGPISKRPENLYVELLNYTLYCDCRHIASTDIRCYAYNSAKGLQYYEYPYHAMRPLNIFEAFRERRRKRREQALRI